MDPRDKDKKSMNPFKKKKTPARPAQQSPTIRPKNVQNKKSSEDKHEAQTLFHHTPYMSPEDALIKILVDYRDHPKQNSGYDMSFIMHISKTLAAVQKTDSDNSRLQVLQNFSTSDEYKSFERNINTGQANTGILKFDDIAKGRKLIQNLNQVIQLLNHKIQEEESSSSKSKP